MPTPADIREILRKGLTSKEGTLELVHGFIEQSIQMQKKSLANDEDGEGICTIYRASMEQFYPKAVEIIYETSESKIEQIFLNSALLTFIYADPLGMVVRHPLTDARAKIAEDRKYCDVMLKFDRHAGTETGGPDSGFHRYLREKRQRGELTEQQVAEFERDYMFMHGLGWYHAWYLAPQSWLQDMNRDGRKIRVDLLAYRLDSTSHDVVIECDGYSYHSDPPAFTADRQRDRLLQAEGFAVTRFSGKEIFDDPVKAGLDLYDFLQHSKRSSALADAL